MLKPDLQLVPEVGIYFQALDADVQVRALFLGELLHSFSRGAQAVATVSELLPQGLMSEVEATEALKKAALGLDNLVCFYSRF